MIVFLLVSALHILFFLYLTYLWSKIEVFDPEPPRGIKVSVLIPIRNEEENIASLIGDLQRQAYPKNMFELLVLDDHSQDHSVRLANNVLSTTGLNYRVLKLQGKTGKKAAIEMGVSQASGELIICTDGDCRIPGNWIATYVSYFERYEPKLVSGPVKMESASWFSHYQALDFSGLIGFGAATLKKGIASTCNGANLAYWKAVFLEVGGYEGNEQIPSGDDEFLLQKVHSVHPEKVHFLKSPEILVVTKPKKSLKSFAQQRVRWSSKWNMHSSLWVKGAAIFAYFDYLSVLFIALLVILGKFPLLFAGGLLILRWISEWVYLYQADKFFNLNSGKRHYPLVSLIFPFYMVFLGIASVFGHYSWKGRRY